MNDPMARKSSDDCPLFSLPRQETPREEQQAELSARRGRRAIAETSLAANATVNRNSDYLCILSWLIKQQHGGTHAEWCIAFNWQTSTSGRFTELAEAGLIAAVPNKTRAAPGRGYGRVYMVTAAGMQLDAEAIASRVREVKDRKKAS